MLETQTEANLINVKYRDSNITQLVHTGDWVDVRISAVTSMSVNSTDNSLEMKRVVQSNGQGIHVSKGSSIKIWHGICLELPENCEAIMLPRGSLFKNTGLIFTCSGVVDEGYKGNNDEWFSTFYATRDVELHHNNRINQFRIQLKQPKLLFKPVTEMSHEDRGGHGSTGGYTQAITDNY